jgi:small GTP-binding protein
MAEHFSKEMELDGERVRIQFWDTAGQELFRSMTSAFYKGCTAVILCYDITSRKSFADLEYWIKEIRNNCDENTPVMLIGTKADLEERREVRSDEAMINAKAREFYFMEVSALTNSNGCVDKAFRAILSQSLANVKKLGDKETLSAFKKSTQIKSHVNDIDSSDEEQEKTRKNSKKGTCC